MLHEFQVENYAVVEKLRVEFGAGLNLLTGETGSGKSIIVDALSLLLGARSSSDVVRAGSRRCRISGVFEVSTDPALEQILDQSGLTLEQGELIVEREVQDTGKSRAYLNGRPVTLSTLKELAPLLADIHGQHEQQTLFSAAAQREMLDSFGGTAGQVRELAKLHAAWQDCAKKLADLSSNEQERLRMLDLYRFQHQEIQQAGLNADEDERLLQEKGLLENVVRVQQAAGSSYDTLYDSPASVSAQLKSAGRAIEELARFEASFGAVRESLESARATIDDAALEIRAFLDRLETDPQRLERIEDRLALIEKLKRKYGATLEEVIRYGEESAQRLAEIESSDSAIARLEREKQELAGEYARRAAVISRKRKQAAAKLGSGVQAELGSLAMEKAVFVAEVRSSDEPAHWTSQGADEVAFLVSANPGQPPRPLSQVASGGELSRITLALKTCLLPEGQARHQSDVPRTLVFDEIDAGVGGGVAESLGRRLARLAQSSQVLCVTHLPQIAAFAQAHYSVSKQERNGSTVAGLTALSPAERIDEIARMVSGEKITEAARKHARQMIRAAQR